MLSYCTFEVIEGVESRLQIALLIWNPVCGPVQPSLILRCLWLLCPTVLSMGLPSIARPSVAGVGDLGVTQPKPLGPVLSELRLSESCKLCSCLGFCPEDYMCACWLPTKTQYYLRASGFSVRMHGFRC